ncbi:hypothetical protein NIES39_C01000 [Arthrospira platensis NIES-39]|nr:hypothetical protein NIES39_C01000 [Arthrospira platensis NIES-39]
MGDACGALVLIFDIFTPLTLIIQPFRGLPLPDKIGDRITFGANYYTVFHRGAA